MHIVIDIPDEKYNRLPYIDIFSLREYIENGTVLPKGHKRLIEDNFKAGPVFDKEGNRIGYQYVTQEDLNNASTIIEADNDSEEKK